MSEYQDLWLNMGASDILLTVKSTKSPSADLMHKKTCPASHSYSPVHLYLQMKLLIPSTKDAFHKTKTNSPIETEGARDRESSTYAPYLPWSEEENSSCLGLHTSHKRSSKRTAVNKTIGSVVPSLICRCPGKTSFSRTTDFLSGRVIIAKGTILSILTLDNLCNFQNSSIIMPVS